jgi:hypothetical protein
MATMRLWITGIALVAATTALSDVNGYYDGRVIDYSNRSEPFRQNGRWMVHARATASGIGGTYYETNGAAQLRVVWRGKVGTITRGQSVYIIDGARFDDGVSPRERNGLIFVSANFFSRLTGGRFRIRDDGNWDNNWNSGGNWNNGGDWNNGGNNSGGWNSPFIIFYGDRTLTYDRSHSPYRGRGNAVMIAGMRTADQIGAGYDRFDNDRQVRIRKDGRTVEYFIGDNFYRLNGRRVNMGGMVGENRNNILFLPIKMYEALTAGRIRYSDPIRPR